MAILQAIDRFFEVSDRGSNLKTELRAGLITFITMAYILPVNVNILSAAGIDKGGIFMATALSAVIGTLLMALWAKLPFAQAPGMGSNVFFAYTIVLAMGFSPAVALAAVFIEGIIFLLLSLSGFRTSLLKSLPHQLRLAISCGIGLFILFLGLQNAGFVIGNASVISQISPDVFVAPDITIAVIGMLVTAGLWLRKVEGALLWGILICWAIGIVAQLTGWYVPDPFVRNFSVIPTEIVSMPPDPSGVFGLCFSGFDDIFASASTFSNFLVVTILLLFMDLFNTLGTFAGVMTKANMMDKDGQFPHANEAFASDAIATTVGAVLGTSTVTTFVESASGVAEGGRTGLTAFTVAVLFCLSIFLFPVISTIPAFATAPALVIVGIMMCEPMAHFRWHDPEALIPGVMTIIIMICGFSIPDGIVWGVLFYIATKCFVGKWEEIPMILRVLGLLFLLKLIFFN